VISKSQQSNDEIDRLVHINNQLTSTNEAQKNSIKEILCALQKLYSVRTLNTYFERKKESAAILRKYKII